MGDFGSRQEVRPLGQSQDFAAAGIDPGPAFRQTVETGAGEVKPRRPWMSGGQLQQVILHRIPPGRQEDAAGGDGPAELLEKAAGLNVQVHGMDPSQVTKGQAQPPGEAVSPVSRTGLLPKGQSWLRAGPGWSAGGCRRW